MADVRITLGIVIVLALLAVVFLGFQNKDTDISGKIVAPQAPPAEADEINFNLLEPQEGDTRNFQEAVVSGIKVCSFEKFTAGKWKQAVEAC